MTVASLQAGPSDPCLLVFKSVQSHPAACVEYSSSGLCDRQALGEPMMCDF